MSDDIFHGLTLDQWCVHAANRRLVDVYANGNMIRAVLVAWRPRKNGRRANTARVEFSTGNRATVKTRFVTPVLEPTAD